VSFVFRRFSLQLGRDFNSSGELLSFTSGLGPLGTGHKGSQAPSNFTQLFLDFAAPDKFTFDVANR
jgi:hypothetical protein